LSNKETKSSPPKSFQIKAEIAFPDKHPMKESLAVKAESEEKALQEALNQFQKRHPRARSITVSTPTATKTVKMGKK
jgi:3-methyladenine DNA glycosylase AlkC